MTEAQSKIEKRARELLADTESDCACRVPHPFNDVALAAIERALTPSQPAEEVREAVARVQEALTIPGYAVMIAGDLGVLITAALASASTATAESVRAATIEECAKVADRRHVGLCGVGPVGRSQVNEARIIATAIRALAKEPR